MGNLFNLGDLIGDIFEKVVNALIRRRIGRWVLVAILALFSLSGFLTISGQSKSDAEAHLIGGVLCGVFALVVLAFTMRYELAVRSVSRVTSDAHRRAQELKASGQLLPIPQVPARSGADVAAAAEYAERMASVPWGHHPTVKPDEARAVFERAVGRVRRGCGDVTQLSEPIDVFVGLPKPLASVGAAEVMYRLSYVRWRTYAPEGLRQGLRFVAHAQYVEPYQPDALVIRVMLLSGCNIPRWLELADQTLAILKGTAPNHPRLPGAEAALQIQRGAYEPALANLEAAIARAPTSDEGLTYRTDRALLLTNMRRHDEALAAYQDVLTREPGDPWMWHDASIFLVGLARYDDALAANSRALAILDFAAARAQRELILRHMAEAGVRAPMGPSSSFERR